MRKLVALAATAAMLVSVAGAGAAGKTTTYNGTIDTGGTIQVKVKKTKKKGKKKTKVVLFRFEGMPIDCVDGTGDETTSGALNFKVPVKKGEFEIDAIIGNPNDPEASLLADGKIKKRKVSGDIHVQGSAVPIDDDGTGDCDSGQAHWSASK